MLIHFPFYNLLKKIKGTDTDFLVPNMQWGGGKGGADNKNGMAQLVQVVDKMVAQTKKIYS